MSTIAISVPLSNQPYQRSGTTGSIQCSGTYTGTAPTHVEARFNGGTWTLLGSESIAAGAWSGTLTGQPQGRGTFDVRYSNDVAVTATVTQIFIGDIFLIWGDSLCGTGEPQYAGTTHTERCLIWLNVWYDTTTDSTGIFAHWKRLYEQIRLDQGVDVAFIQTGVAGSEIQADWDTTGGPKTNYTNALAQVTASAITGCRACLVHIGTNSVNGSTYTIAQIRDALRHVAGQFAADVPGAPASYLSIFPDRDHINGGTGSVYRASMDVARQAIIDAIGLGSPCARGVNDTGMAPADRNHPDTDAMSQEAANHWWVALKGQSYGGTVHRGPRISSARFTTNAQTAVRVTMDQSLSNAVSSSVGGFSVWDGSTQVTVNSQTVFSDTIIVLTLAAHTFVGSPTVSVASADDAVGATVPRGVAITMPDATTQALPVEPQFSVTVDAAVNSGVSRSRMQLCM